MVSDEESKPSGVASALMGANLSADPPETEYYKLNIKRLPILHTMRWSSFREGLTLAFLKVLPVSVYGPILIGADPSHVPVRPEDAPGDGLAALAPGQEAMNAAAFRSLGLLTHPGLGPVEALGEAFLSPDGRSLGQLLWSRTPDHSLCICAILSFFADGSALGTTNESLALPAPPWIDSDARPKADAAEILARHTARVASADVVTMDEPQAIERLEEETRRGSELRLAQGYYERASRLDIMKVKAGQAPE